MAQLFRQKELLNAHSPVSLSCGFKKLILRLIQTNANWESDGHGSEFSNSCTLTIVCRQVESVAEKSACVAFPLTETTICAVCERSQYEAVHRAIENEKSSLQVIIENEDDDGLATSTILQRAIERGLVAALLKQGWTLLDNNVLLFGNIATWEEGRPLLAISWAVHLDRDDQIIFVVSPDAICFRRSKPLSVLPETWRKKFDDGQFVDTTKLLRHYDNGDAFHEFQCCVLPSMEQGHITGMAKALPESKTLYQQQQFWTYHCGMEIPKSCFYVDVLLQNDNHNLCLPSSLILKKSGLMPAAPSVRCLKAACSIEHFRRTAAEWNFFNAGNIRFKACASKNTDVTEIVTWTTASKTLLPSGCTNGWNDALADYDTEIQALTGFKTYDIKKFYRTKPISNLREKEEPKKFHATGTLPLQVKLVSQVTSGQTTPGVQKPAITIVPTWISRKGQQRQSKFSIGTVENKASSIGLPKFKRKSSFEGVQKPAMTTMPTWISHKEQHRKSEISNGLPTLKQKVPVEACTNGEPMIKKKRSTTKTIKGHARCSQTETNSKEFAESFSPPAWQNGCSQISPQSRSGPCSSAIEKGSQIAPPADNIEGLITDINSSSKLDGLQTTCSKPSNSIGTVDTESSIAIDILVFKKHAENRLKDLNVTQLKNFLRSRKSKLSGKKEELIERIQHVLKT